MEAQDNTVRYNWRTLQLLPRVERPSYAGAKIVVLELPGGSLWLPRRNLRCHPQGAPGSATYLELLAADLADHYEYRATASTYRSSNCLSHQISR